MRFITLAVVLTLVAGCTVLKTDPEKNVKDFLATFQDKIENDTTKSGLLSMFKTDQSEYSIMQGLKVLQNRAYPYVNCVAIFGQAAIINDSLGLRVDLPIVFSADYNEFSKSENTLITLWLTPVKNSYVISKFDAENFYNVFLNLENELSWIVDEQDLMESHKRYFRAKENLSKKYDSVVWVATYKEADYYYVTSGGKFDLENPSETMMGIVDSLGNIIVPFDYSSIGNPGVMGESIVEVRLGQNVGLYDFEKKKEIVKPEFDWIVPFEEGKDHTFAFKNIIGYIDRAGNFTEGFANEADKKSYQSLSYIPEQIEFSAGTQTMLESPDEQRFGSGLLITPAYLSATGIFKPSYGDFSMDGTSYRASTSSVATRRSFFGAVSETIDAILTTISSEYLEGRESFYATNEMKFVNHEGQIVGSIGVASSDVVMRKVDSTLFELKSTYEGQDMMYYEGTGEDENVPTYTYVQYLAEDESMVQLESNRLFTFTQYVKIDSSYFEGNFDFYNEETGLWDTRSFLGLASVNRMYNEILADNGYSFPENEAMRQSFESFSWYKPAYKTVDEAMAKASEIDKYNLKFIEKLLLRMKAANSDPKA